MLAGPQYWPALFYAAVRKAKFMKTINRIERVITAAGLSLAVAGGLGLPLPAFAAGSNKTMNSSCRMQTSQSLKALHQKMLAEAKAEDATLQKMVAELKHAPEAQKADVEAAILENLVAAHHQMLQDWEAAHARIAQHQPARKRMEGTGITDSDMRNWMGSIASD